MRERVRVRRSVSSPVGSSVSHERAKRRIETRKTARPQQVAGLRCAVLARSQSLQQSLSPPTSCMAGVARVVDRARAGQTSRRSKCTSVGREVGLDQLGEEKVNE